MKVVKPLAECIDLIDKNEIYSKLELCGRVCYQSEPKENSAEKFIRMLIKRGHESVLEHVSLTFHIITDRAILAELTRHRLASFSVESTRYCKYTELTVVEPPFFDADNKEAWRNFCQSSGGYYANFLKSVPPEQARLMLPQSTKVELYMTANLREWRHILKLRTDKAAHPQMRELMEQVLTFFKQCLPVIVEDIA